ncbi:MAG: hypothetical protein KDA72_14955, partial [Planctomycetales bacterium]|nr:hypothetical protein [Planctomycetales bacterium]
MDWGADTRRGRSGMSAGEAEGGVVLRDDRAAWVSLRFFLVTGTKGCPSIADTLAGEISAGTTSSVGWADLVSLSSSTNTFATGAGGTPEFGLCFEAG